MIIYDNIHGYISVDDLAISIIDTPIFQRLKYINQTGVLYMVFPSANHSRFAHSIGTYYLANQMIKNLAYKHPEININEEIIQLVSIAGLCHDLGHLIYSHLFDNYFLKKLPHYQELKNITKYVSHENRSIYLLHHLVERYNIKLNLDQLKVICDLIDPYSAEYNKWLEKYQIGKWIFQIISNPVNSIDVDKFDYLIRDTQSVGLKFSFNFSRIIKDAKIINNQICYSLQCSEDIYHMFFIRYRLHRQIYNHKTVQSLEILIVKLLFELEKEIKLSEYILNSDKMLLLVDYFIWTQTKNDNIIKLINDIHMRNITKLVYQDISLNINDFINLETKIKETFDTNIYEIIIFQVGYANNTSNPLNKILFYNNKTNEVITNNKVKNFSLLLNQNHQEYVFRVYCIDLTKLNLFYQFFKNI